jgi:hypothetical protein
MKTMKKTLWALCALVGLGGCGDLTVPNLNNPSIESLETNPTRAVLLDACTGLIIGHRMGTYTQTGYVSMMGVLGRESYVLDSTDPRSVSEMLQGPGLNGGSPSFGGNFWTAPYANIRNAHILLDALDKVAGMTPAEKEAIRGYAKTMQALDFLVVVITRDTNGAPIDVNRPLGGELAPIESKEAVLAHIAALLDQAKTHLEAGGESFPFTLSSGFKGFNTPATFLKFNRGMKARVDVYQKNWDQALNDLSESFLDPEGPLDQGVYHSFGTGSGDVKNELNDPNIFANKVLVDDAEFQASSTTLRDDRVLRKLKTTKTKGELPGSKKEFSLVFAQYESDTAPIPMIRNEELILLRAEAHIGLGHNADAMADLNRIRVRSGKLARIDEILGGENIVNELLEQRRYSLLLEGGHRWIDMRRYGKLDELRREDPPELEFKVHVAYPIPDSEMDARK